jgi:membrane peptidoglycan carboxypeptidase
MKKIFLNFILGISLYICLPLFSAYLLFFFHHAQFDLFHYFLDNSYTIYDRNNKEIKKNYPYVHYQNIPQHTINAFIATEDANFFNHYGISLTSIIRSIVYNLKKRKFAQGGSTITQQLIKVYKGNFKKTITRKITDILLALLIETIYSKETIFEAYCNIIYLGKNITGLAECARVLFNKEYTELDVDESAMIAGIIKRPEYYNPLNNLEECEKRKLFVLKRMLLNRLLTQQEYEFYKKKKTIIAEDNDSNINSTPLYSHIQQEMKKLSFANNHSYEIYTTIDQTIQRELMSVIEKHKKDTLKKIPQMIMCAAIIDIHKGDIVALYDNTKHSNAQPACLYTPNHIGSLLKPIIFYFATVNGDKITDIYNDAPLDQNIFGSWQPKNHYNKFLGTMSGIEALEKSNNSIPIQLLQKHNIHKFIAFIQPYFNNNIKPYFSVALGCIDALPLEIATLYYHFFASILSEQRTKVKKNLSCIKKVIKKSGGLLFKENADEITNPFEYHHTYEIASVLKNIGTRFVKKNNFELQKAIYAKTGTTNHATCCWSVATDLQYLIVVFVSSRNNEKLYNKYSLTSANTTIPINIEVLRNI